ncbi:hypothetical protein DXT77_12655 [Pseudomonas sp. 91RF]|uniref:hypothetical protein n=1 Tax=Pseudomonas sp. 91RF TaxID=2292261 RepID=UPI000E66A663|nr:hypothetical protein [Pseudomonas sp. 91RF]RIJ10612.1 hypothetical protein DXT77_12655 [Pseudomonas sp. 91RF]
MSSISVTSQTWLQNFRPYVNGTKVRWPDLYLSLMAGECIDLTLEFEYSYLIGDPESPLKLCCEPDVESLGLECDPPFGQLVEMKEGLIELTWHICARKTSGAPFELHFEMPFYQGMPPSPLVPGKIEDVLIDSLRCDRPVTYVGYEVNAQALMLASPSGRPQPGATLKWSYAEKSLPDSISGTDGNALNTLIAELGEHTLAVVQPSGNLDSKTLEITGLPMPDATFYGASFEPKRLNLGETIHISLVAQERFSMGRLEGIKVILKQDEKNIDMSYSDDRGQVRMTFTPAQSGSGRISVHMYAQTESSASSSFLVLDAEG